METTTGTIRRSAAAAIGTIRRVLVNASGGVTQTRTPISESLCQLMLRIEHVVDVPLTPAEYSALWS